MKGKKSTKEKKEQVKQIKQPRQKKHITYETRLIAKILTIVVLLFFFFIFLFNSIKINIYTNINYYQTSSLDYLVRLKPNNYYEEKTLGKNLQYIASLIDTVDVKFNYNFTVSERIDYKYSYYINAEIVVRDGNSENVILSQKENIIDEKTFELQDSNTFYINEQVNVDYDKYNDIVRNFKSEYALSANSDLILSLYVKIMDNEGNELKTINADNSMKVIIPLTQQTINIALDYKEVNNSDSLLTHKKFNISNVVFLIITAIIFIILIIRLLDLLKFMGKTTKKRTAYDKMLAKFLREYDRIIVESKKDIIFSEDQYIIDVKSFNELLDARDNLEKPIIFHEIHKHEKAVFVVKNAQEVYRYILKLVDLEKEKKK